VRDFWWCELKKTTASLYRVVIFWKWTWYSITASNICCENVNGKVNNFW
jgi:hypothetical protein